MISYVHDTNSGVELILSENSLLSYPLHNHVSVFTVGTVLRGNVILTSNGISKICKNNESFVIPPYVTHKISGENPYTMLNICLPRGNIEKYSLDFLNETIKKYFHTKQHIISPSIFKLLKSVSAKQVFYKQWIKGLLQQIELNPANELSIENMASEVNKSKFDFIRQFKKEIGLTPHYFKIQNMIRNAQRLLDTDFTIAEVAMTAGFYDQSHFIRHFKRVTGLTPSDYKSSRCQFNSKLG